MKIQLNNTEKNIGKLAVKTAIIPLKIVGWGFKQALKLGVATSLALSQEIEKSKQELAQK
jgi:hypothetical protein